MALTVESNLPENLVSLPPLMTSIVDGNGKLTRAWSIWFRDLYDRTASGEGNAIDAIDSDMTEIVAQILVNIDDISANAFEILVNSENIEINATAIQENYEAIQANIEDIQTNKDDILINAGNISALTITINNHTSASEAHGSNGDIVGKNDLSTEALYGLVKRMSLVADAIDSTAEVTQSDAGVAPATYDQAYAQSMADLANANKTAMNQAITDLNSAISVINAIIDNSKTSGQMSND